MDDLEQRINIYLSNHSTTAIGFEENIDVYDMMKDALMEFVPQEIEHLQKEIGRLAQENEQLRKDLVENQSDCEMCNFPKLYKRCFELLKKYAEIGSPMFDEDFVKLENTNEEAREFIKENS